MALSACQYCGRQNEADAQFCNDCGKPLTKAAVVRAAVAAGSRSGGVSRTSGPPAPGMGAAADPPAPCPLCGTIVTAHSGGGPERRFSPDRRSDHSLSPLHAKLAWEEGRLEVRDLGSRNGTWVFLETPYRLTDGDLILIGSQVLRFRRLGYPGPHAAEADATKRMGSMVPSADIASLTQLRSDGSSRDVIQLSPGRDVHVGRERGDWIFPYDPSMSAQHAMVRSEDADFVLVDDHS